MDATDLAGILLFFAISFGLPLLGYWLMVLDIRAYYRALRRALVVATHFMIRRPGWAVKQPPRALQALELDETCTESDVRAAYRRLAEQCHPDLGGDPHEFTRLGKMYEDALAYARRKSHS